MATNGTIYFWCADKHTNGQHSIFKMKMLPIYNLQPMEHKTGKHIQSI